MNRVKNMISRLLIATWLVQIAMPMTYATVEMEDIRNDELNIYQGVGAGAGLPILFIASLCASAFPAAKIWIGGTDTTWNTAGNWSASGVPGTTDTVTIDSQATKNCGLNANGSVYRFRFLSNATATFSQTGTATLTVGAGGFSQAGGTFIGKTSNIIIGGTYTLSGGTFTSTSGTLSILYDFTVNSGTFTHNNGLIKMDNANNGGYTVNLSIGLSSNKLTLGSLWLYQGRQGEPGDRKYYTISSGDTLLITKTFRMSSNTSSGSLSTCYANTGVIEARDSVIAEATAYGGSAILLINGNTTQYYKSTGGILPHVNIATSGTFTAASGTSTLGVTSFTLNSGTFSAPTTLNLYGIASTTNTCNLIVNGGTFSHNNGTTAFNHYAQGNTQYITIGLASNKLELGSLAFYQTKTDDVDQLVYEIGLGDTLLVTGNYTQGNTGSGGGRCYVTTGVIEARGNVSLVANCNGGNVSTVFSGSAAAQTLTYSGAAMTSGLWTVNKTSGSVVLGSNISFPAKFRMLSGGFSMGASYNYTAADSTIVNSGCTFTDTGVGDITLAAAFRNDGTTMINGLGDGCGNGDSIFIRSSVNGTRRNWGGTGIYQVMDVKIRDMSSTPAITAYSSTDSLNNTTNWTIDANCYTPVITNIRPAAAKRTAIVTMNGTGFLAAQGTGQIVIGTIGLGTAQSWSATAIVDTVPVTATFGTNNAIITNTCVGKDTAIFRVTNPGITIP